MFWRMERILFTLERMARYMLNYSELYYKAIELRSKYTPGTRVRLVKMDDIQAPPVGTIGTVVGVDDIASLLVNWDNGSHLHVVYGEDIVEIIPENN